MATLEEGCEVAIVLVLQSMCSFTSQKCPSVPKIALLFSKSALLFSRIPLTFLEFPFYFPEVFFCFPEVTLYFSKIPYCFRELPFSFPEVPSIYLLYMSFPKNSFFAADCTLPSCSELVVREIIFTFFLFCFLMEPFIDQLMMPSW